MTLSPEVQARIEAHAAKLLKDARPPTEAQLKVLRRVFGPGTRRAEPEPPSDQDT